MTVDPLIRIAQGYFPPYANVCPNVTYCENPGIDTTLLIMKLTALKFRVEFFNVDSKFMMESIRNGSADITGSTAPLTESLFREFEATNSVLNDKALLMVKSSKIHNRSLLFSMSDWPVWLLLLLCLGFVLIFKILATKIRRRCFDKLRSLELPLAAWGLTFTAIFYTATSFLAIIFSQQIVSPPPFKSFESFTRKLASGECTVYINQTLSEDVGDLLPKNRNLSFFLKIIHKHHILKTLPDERSLVLKILASNKQQCNIGMIYKSERSLYESMSCNVQFLDFDEFPNSPYVYYYRRDFPYSHLLALLEASDDYYQITIDQFAKQRFVKNKMYENEEYLKSDCVPPSRRGGKEASVVDPLDLYQLMDIFLMLIVGIAFGLLLHFTSLTNWWQDASDLLF